MLFPDQLDVLSGPVVDVFEEYILSVIKDIARRISGLPRATATAAWQLQRVSEAGAIYEDAIKQLSRITKKSEDELTRMFQEAGVKSIRYDDKIYKAAGLEPLPLNMSPAMAQALSAGLRKTQGVMMNLTKTTAITAQRSFIECADQAYLQISTGTMSYDQAIRAAVKKAAADGLQVIDYSSGHQDLLDVAMRRTILTGVSQTTGVLQIARADEMGVDLVQTSAHSGARNKGTGPKNHESWQGRIFSRSGKHPKYPDFVKSTGYGTIEGLLGVNCRHSFFPYFEGLSENAYTRDELRSMAREKREYKDRAYTLYEATQKQREIERNIRYWKRQAGALEAAGLEHSMESGKVKEWQSVMRDFINQTELRRQPPREQI
jgi:hypothetical protein